jgi:hypothetical protein
MQLSVRERDGSEEDFELLAAIVSAATLQGVPTISTSSCEDSVHVKALRRKRTSEYNTTACAQPSCKHIPLRDSLLLQFQQTSINTGHQSDAHKHFHNSVEERSEPSCKHISM